MRSVDSRSQDEQYIMLAWVQRNRDSTLAQGVGDGTQSL